MSKPLLLPADGSPSVFHCEECEREKSRGLDRGWVRGEGYEDIEVTGLLPPGEDFGTVTCKYGHETKVVRAETERAHGFGY